MWFKGASWSQAAGAQVPALLLIISLSLATLPNLSEPQVPYVLSEAVPTPRPGLWGGITELAYVKSLEEQVSAWHLTCAGC